MSKEDVINQIEMEAGEIQLRKVFEENTIHNVKLIVDYSKQTREMVRQLEEKVKHLESTLMSEKQTNTELRNQLALVQAKLYSGGTV